MSEADLKAIRYVKLLTGFSINEKLLAVSQGVLITSGKTYGQPMDYQYTDTKRKITMVKILDHVLFFHPIRFGGHNRWAIKVMPRSQAPIDPDIINTDTDFLL